MRDGRQEEVWKYVAKICYITAVFQSTDPKKIKLEDFNDWEQIQKVLNQKSKPTDEQLGHIARMFQRNT